MFRINLSIIIMIILCVQFSYTQSSDLSLFSSGGDMAQAGSLNLSYSIGEPCINYTQSGMNWITEGFQQPGKINLTSIEVNSLPKYSLMIFPNPVSSELHIESTHQVHGQLIQITNILGQPMLAKSLIVEQTMVIDLNHLRPGIYFLNILDPSSTQISQPFIKL